MINKLLALDCETGPLPEEELMAKFDPEFHPSASLKEPTINRSLKDPEKVEANRLEVEERRRKWESDIADDLALQRQDWIQDGALKAERGRLLAFGWKWRNQGVIGDTAMIHLEQFESEAKFLEAIIDKLSGAKSKGFVVAGFNLIDFDLPFIRRRCIINGVKFPFYDRWEKWKPWTLEIYDAMKDWASGEWGRRISLDDLARGMECGQKNGDGALFHQLYFSDKREEALDYLANDVDMTYNVCERMLA